MILHGGARDTFGTFAFQPASEAYQRALRAAGHFAFICNHGGGHTLPSAATASIWRFFQDHPFGTRPSPYAASLPAGFPTYCTL